MIRLNLNFYDRLGERKKSRKTFTRETRRREGEQRYLHNNRQLTVDLNFESVIG